jgi:type I restriction enzyme, S subunit
MAVWSIVNKKYVVEKQRIDAEYYKPEFIDLEKRLRRFKNTETLDGIAYVTGGKRLPKGEVFSDKGAPYIRVVDIANVFVDFEEIRYISEELQRILNNYQVREKDILLTIVGNTVGLTGYIHESKAKCFFTENVARIRPKEFPAEYLLAVLLSVIGQHQVTREKVGTAQPKLALERLRKFAIPLVKSDDQEKIVSSINKAVNLSLQSKKLYSQAEEILADALEIKEDIINDDLFYTATLSEGLLNKRIDAEYFLPKYKRLAVLLEKHKSISLGKIVSRIKKGIEVGGEQYADDGKLFIRVSNLSKIGLNNDNQKYVDDGVYKRLVKEYQPHQGEILLSKDATPGIAYVLKDPVEGILSSGIVRLSVNKNIKSEYVALIINSIIGKLQIQRESGGGSIINHWKPEQIRNLLIPMIDNNIQKRIEDLCTESFLRKKEARRFLDESKQKVEEVLAKVTGENNGF